MSTISGGSGDVYVNDVLVGDVKDWSMQTTEEKTMKDRITVDGVEYEPVKDAGMNAAIDKSIEHWQKLFDEARGVDYAHGRDCTLCGKYYKRGGNCGTCPIANDGHEGCSDTPFNRYREARRDLINAAEAEITYLKSLKK